MSRIEALKNEKHLILIIPIKVADRLAVLLDDTGDWLGNIDPVDIGLTSKGFTAAEEDFNTILTALQEASSK